MATPIELQFARQILENDFGVVVSTVGYTLLAFSNLEGFTISEIGLYLREVVFSKTDGLANIGLPGMNAGNQQSNSSTLNTSQQQTYQSISAEDIRNSCLLLYQHNIVTVSMMQSSTSIKSNKNLLISYPSERYCCSIDAILFRPRFPDYLALCSDPIVLGLYTNPSGNFKPRPVRVKKTKQNQNQIQNGNTYNGKGNGKTQNLKLNFNNTRKRGHREIDNDSDSEGGPEPELSEVLDSILNRAPDVLEQILLHGRIDYKTLIEKLKEQTVGNHTDAVEDNAMTNLNKSDNINDNQVGVHIVQTSQEDHEIAQTVLQLLRMKWISVVSRLRTPMEEVINSSGTRSKGGHQDLSPRSKDGSPAAKRQKTLSGTAGTATGQNQTGENQNLENTIVSINNDNTTVTNSNGPQDSSLSQQNQFQNQNNIQSQDMIDDDHTILLRDNTVFCPNLYVLNHTVARDVLANLARQKFGTGNTQIIAINEMANASMLGYNHNNSRAGSLVTVGGNTSLLGGPGASGTASTSQIQNYHDPSPNLAKSLFMNIANSCNLTLIPKEDRYVQGTNSFPVTRSELLEKSKALYEVEMNGCFRQGESSGIVSNTNNHLNQKNNSNSVPTLDYQKYEDLCDTILNRMAKEFNGIISKGSGYLDDHNVNQNLSNINTTGQGSKTAKAKAKSKAGAGSKNSLKASTEAMNRLEMMGLHSTAPGSSSSSLNNSHYNLLWPEARKLLRKDIHARLVRWSHGQLCYRIYSLLAQEPLCYRTEEKIEQSCLVSIERTREGLNKLFLSSIIQYQELPKGSHSVASGPPPQPGFGSGTNFGKGVWMYGLDIGRLNLVLKKLIVQTILNIDRRRKSEDESIVTGSNGSHEIMKREMALMDAVENAERERLGLNNNSNGGSDGPDGSAPSLDPATLATQRAAMEKRNAKRLFITENRMKQAMDVLRSRYLMLQKMYLLIRDV